MDALDRFLEFHTERITAGAAVPVDLARLSSAIGAVVEEREMIPEAAMQADKGRFRIFLQSNFTHLPGIPLRQRFSLAHEIGHTLFYEQLDDDLRPRKDSPKGEQLESACHRAAALILVPTKLLKAELRENEIEDSAAIINLATRFQVSVEVMLRRLNEVGAYDRDWVPVLTRRDGQTHAIEYAVYPPWLMAWLTTPVRGKAFETWFSGTARPDGVLERKMADGILEARSVELSRRSVLFELRVQPAFAS